LYLPRQEDKERGKKVYFHILLYTALDKFGWLGSRRGLLRAEKADHRKILVESQIRLDSSGK
jgi:hypothetical protein